MPEAEFARQFQGKAMVRMKFFELGHQSLGPLGITDKRSRLHPNHICVTHKASVSTQLGLTVICKTRVARYRRRIWVQLQRRQGSTFCFILWVTEAY